MPLDVPRLLVAARHRAGVSQTKLVDLTGVSRASLVRYEAGTASPTVEVFDRLLAGCGLQLRVALEPVTGGADAKAVRLLQDEVELDLEEWTRVARWLDNDPACAGLLDGGRARPAGPVTWAFDGGTALALHGFAAHAPDLGLALVYDEAAQWWLRSVQVQAFDPRGRRLESWLETGVDEARQALQGMVLSRLGPVRLRVVEALPPVVTLHGLPAVRLDEVEAHFPEWSQALAQLRERGQQDGVRR